MNRDQHVTYFEPLTDSELEIHIRSCGELMQAEYEAGNKEAAENWLQAMQEAVRARSTTQVLRMEAERGLCQFVVAGESDRWELTARESCQ